VSVNVAADPTGYEDLRRLGARSIPVVSKGDRFVFAQILGDVSDFLGLGVDTAPTLSPAELAVRIDHVLETAARLIRQIPDDALGGKLPNRDRTFRVLTYHIFQIPEVFLELVQQGLVLTHERLGTLPPDDMQTSAAIADFGDTVRARVAAWWAGAGGDTDFDAPAETYYGEPKLHEVFERTTWHSAQHVRQLCLVLDGLDVEPDRPLSKADLEGLPVPEKVCDD
jgi:hypothetical protein